MAATPYKKNSLSSENNMIPINVKPIIPALNMSELREDALDTYAQEKDDKLTDNPNYPLPFPEKVAMVEALSAYRTSQGQADDGNSIDTETKNFRKEVLENSLITLAFRCAAIANGDVLMFLSSGFQVRKAAARHAKPDRVQNATALDSVADGSIALVWDALPDARCFVVEMTENSNNASSWIAVLAGRGGASTKSETLITGLTPGKRYWFRVAGINAGGLGDFSDPATRISQ